MKIRMMIYQIARTVSTQDWRILGVTLRRKRDLMTMRQRDLMTMRRIMMTTR